MLHYAHANDLKQKMCLIVPVFSLIHSQQLSKSYSAIFFIVRHYALCSIFGSKKLYQTIHKHHDDFSVKVEMFFPCYFGVIGLRVVVCMFVYQRLFIAMVLSVFLYPSFFVYYHIFSKPAQQDGCLMNTFAIYMN